MSRNRYLALAWLLASAPAPAADISVLLPLSGATAKTAESIRNGLLAGYYQAVSQGKTSDTLHFYDTGAGTDLQPVLDMAVTPTTRLLIGPLLKEQVNTLLLQPPAVPVLALNRVNNSASSQVWQYALAPEEEIPPLIRLMRQAGIKRVRVLMQADAASERLRTAFEQAWRADGGELLPVYALHQTSHEGLTDSVRQLLAEPPTAKAQAFFLASPQLALAAQPLLRFYQREPLPVYTGSLAYDPERTRLERQDLNGLRFCGLPWAITPQQWPETTEHETETGGYGRLYAFGADAWAISQQLGTGNKTAIRGRTGTLLLADGQVQRYLPCAEVSDGQATLVPTTAGPGR